MLSEASARLLAELKAMPDGTMCPTCAAARMAVSRWDALKSIRELVATGKVACGPSVCSSCRKQELVAFLRPVPFARAPSRPRVLVVDDAEEIRDLYAIFLRAEGFDVTTAADGVAGLDLAQELRPDVIILDVTIPRMTGLEVTRRLKAPTEHARFLSLSSAQCLTPRTRSRQAPTATA
jgi:CheY-like chemotaxis protein